MYNRKTEFKDIFSELDKIPTDIEMTNIKKTVKKKVFRHKIVSATRNVVVVFIALFAMFTVGVNVSPTFAKTVSEISFLKQLVQSVNFNEGYSDAIENEYMTKVDQVKETKFGDIRLSYYIADKKDMVFFFKAQNVKENIEKENLFIMISSIRNIDTGEEADEIGGVVPYFDGEYAVASLGMWPDGFEYPDNLEVVIQVGYNGDTELISFQLEMSEPLAERVYEVNKQIEHRGQKYTIDRVTIYPTCTYVEYSEDESNTMEIINIDFHLEDENGVERGEDRAVTIWDDNGIYIASGYFTLGNDISLILDDLWLLPKEKKMVTYNVKTKEFSDCDGKLEYVYILEDEELLEKYGGVVDKYEIPFLIDRSELKERGYNNSFSAIDEKTGEALTWCGTRWMEEITIYTMPKSVEKDEDGIVTLEREFAEYFDEPNIVIPVE